MSLRKHSCQDLIKIFSDSFSESEYTALVGGASEPFYQPWEGGEQAQIHFRKDYFSSALHEVAHWCIAGDERRKLPDYGYWYIEDGRDEAQQRSFFQVEVKPQSLEWMFSVACGLPFTVSVDNTNISTGVDWQYWEELERDKERFKNNCRQQINSWLDGRMPGRAQIFLEKLLFKYRAGYKLSRTDFD